MTEEEKKACRKAMDLLTVRDRSEAELSERLRRAGFSEELTEKAMAYVRSFGYISDERFAYNYLDSLRESRSLSRMRFDLKKKGISSELIDQALEEMGGIDERPLIRKLALRKLRTFREDTPRKKEKVCSYLSGKGFRISDILSVAEEIFPEE